jgi:predicted small secreted protein
MNRIITLATTIALCLGLAACNTVRGIGQDVKKAGEVIEGAGKK